MDKLPLDTITKQNIDPDLKKLLSELISRELKYQSVKFYSGKVVNNNDPEKLGRCKIRVFGIFDDEIENDALPWALPDMHFVGSFRGSMIIPPKEALVRVYFDNGDIYSPIYTTKIPEKKSPSQQAGKDYPDTMVFFETDNGDYFQINRKTAETTFHTAGGVLVRFDKKGNMSIDTTEAELLYGGKIQVNVNGDIDIKSVGNITSEAIGTLKDVAVPNPFEVPNPADPNSGIIKTPTFSKNNLHSSGDINIIALGNPTVTNTDPIPNPKNPTDVQISALRKIATNAINIISKSATKPIKIFAMMNDIILQAMKNIKLIATGDITITGKSITIGTGVVDAILKSQAFASFFDAHTHGTGTGPSTPPIVPMSSQLTTMTSKIVKVGG